MKDREFEEQIKKHIEAQPLERVEYFLKALIYGVDNNKHHCEQLDVISSHMYMAMEALKALNEYQTVKTSQPAGARELASRIIAFAADRVGTTRDVERVQQMIEDEVAQQTACSQCNVVKGHKHWCTNWTPAATGSGAACPYHGHLGIVDANCGWCPKPTTLASQPTVNKILWESREKFKQIHAYLNSKTPDIEQAKALCKSGRKILDEAIELFKT